MSMEQPRGISELDSKKAFRIALHFARHAEKAGDNRVPWEIDESMPLTERGREQARDLHKRVETSDALAVGGQRLRLRETALFASSGEEAGSFEELREMLDASGKKYGQRMWKLAEGLDIPYEKGTPFFERLQIAYDKGEYLKEIIKMDAELLAQGKRNESVYAQQALGIAKILQWCAKAAPTLRASSMHHGDTLLREAFVSTQGGIGESFLAELVLRTKGKEESERFIDAVPNGFRYTEGFDVDIVNKGEESMARIRFTAGESGSFVFDETVSAEMLGNIVKDLS